MKLSRLKSGVDLAIAIPLVLANRALLAVGLRKRLDGWRRGAGLALRGEAGTFVLSAFGINSGSEPVEITARLARFLARETSVHFCIVRDELESRGHPSRGPSYSVAFQSWVEGPARFIRPEVWSDASNRDASNIDPLINIVCRIGPGGIADLWFRFNHVGIDGVPAQEIVSRLEQEWGSSERIFYPSPEEFAAWHAPRSCCGRSELAEVQAFIDFSPLLDWRRRINATLAEPMTFSAALMWCMARQATFANLRIGTTAEIPAIGELGRGVGVVVLRPSNYFQRADGLKKYVRDFNRQLDLNRRRKSEGCKTLDALAHLPPRLAGHLLRTALSGNRAFGSIGLTIIKDAKVFGAPMGDVGHPDGFIAIGSLGLNTTHGRKVGCVTVKGPPERIAHYPTLLRQVVENIH